MQRLLRADFGGLGVEPGGTEASRFAPDSGRSSVDLMSPKGVRSEFVVSDPGDVYEQEADRVAERFQNADALRAPAIEEGERREPLVARTMGGVSESGGPVPPIVRETLAEGGQPLDTGVRRIMEPVLGHDFSRVRIHTGERAVESTQTVNAKAYTAGNHVAFAVGQYAPHTQEGQRLLAHELAHVVQQRSSLPLAVGATASPSTGLHHVATFALQRQVSNASKSGATPDPGAVREFEADRLHFDAEAAKYFAEIGRQIQESVLQAAGFKGGQRLSSPEEALLVAQTWGLSLDQIKAQLPDIIGSLSGQVTGRHETDTLAQQQQQLIAALSPAGQQAYRRTVARVRAEPFWARHLDTSTIYIFPDLAGDNRYAGYTQKGSSKSSEGPSGQAFIIHISRTRLEAGQVEESSATLIHELSHTLYEPNVTEKAMGSLLGSLAELLTDHPQVKALRQGAAEPELARAQHVRRVRQILFERTAYAEAEVFVHLQQLTNQPDVQIDGERTQAHHYILDIVQGYADRLRRIHLPPRLLRNVFDMLGRKTAYLYDRRIAATPAGSKQRKLLELSKNQALLILRIASTPGD